MRSSGRGEAERNVRRAIARPHARATSRIHALCVLMLTGGIACASSAPESKAGPMGPTPIQISEDLADAPSWVSRSCRLYWSDADEARRALCAVGSAPPARNRTRARETAVARARAEITRSLQVTIESMIRDVDTENGSARLDAFSHEMAMATLPRTEVKALWYSPSGTIYTLVALSIEGFEASVRQNRTLPEPVRQTTLDRARDAFADLADEMERYDQD